MSRTLSLFILAALAASACGGGDSSSSTPTSPSQPSAPYSQTDLRVGTGTEATNGRTLAVNYTLWLYSPTGREGKGQKVQTTVAGSPYSFGLGSNQVIAGWNQGVPGMRIGGLRRLVLPPSLAYGST